MPRQVQRSVGRRSGTGRIPHGPATIHTAQPRRVVAAPSWRRRGPPGIAERRADAEPDPIRRIRSHAAPATLSDTPVSHDAIRLLCLPGAPLQNRPMPAAGACRATASAGTCWTWRQSTATLAPRVAPWKCLPSTSGSLGIRAIALEPTSEQPVASFPAFPGLASLSWLTTRSRRATFTDDPPDRTTIEWLRHARRDEGVRRASTEQV